MAFTSICSMLPLSSAAQTNCGGADAFFAVGTVAVVANLAGGCLTGNGSGRLEIANGGMSVVVDVAIGVPGVLVLAAEM